MTGSSMTSRRPLSITRRCGNFSRKRTRMPLRRLPAGSLKPNSAGSDADEQVLEELKRNYLEVESWMEDLAGEGDYQGGNVDIVTKDDMTSWGDSMDGILAKVHAKHSGPRNMR